MQNLPYFAANTNGFSRSQGNVNERTIVWLASLTKAITAFGVLTLVDKGKISLSSKISDFIPQFKNLQVLETDGSLRPAKGEITLKSLLTHTSGFSYEMWNPHLSTFMRENDIPRTASCRLKSLDVPLMRDPNTGFDYSISLDFVGRVIEVISGQTLATYLNENIFTPLGMVDTTFVLSDEQKTRVLPMHARQNDGSLKPMPFSTPAEQEFNMGGGGLWGTAHDYLLFLEMLLTPNKMLSQNLKNSIFENHLGDLEYQFQPSVNPNVSRNFEFMQDTPKKWGLLGMINTQDVPNARKAFSTNWTGLANCFFWADPQSKVGGLLLSQCLPFGDEEVLKAFEAFEKETYSTLA